MPNSIAPVIIEAGFLGCSDVGSFKGSKGESVPIFSASFYVNNESLKINIVGADKIAKLKPICDELTFGSDVELHMLPFVKDDKLQLRLENLSPVN